MATITAGPALSRFRVLDLWCARAGPTCVRMLADLGADVIRIDPPKGVDPNETMIGADRTNGDFQNFGRNERSLSLNLKKPEGLRVFTLGQDAPTPCDLVLIKSFRVWAD